LFQAFNLTKRANFGSNYHNSSAFMQPQGFINPSSVTISRSFSADSASPSNNSTCHSFVFRKPIFSGFI
jgi:hypothetical protein